MRLLKFVRNLLNKLKCIKQQCLIFDLMKKKSYWLNERLDPFFRGECMHETTRFIYRYKLSFRSKQNSGDESRLRVVDLHKTTTIWFLV